MSSDQVVEGHERPRPLAHRRALAALDEVDELHDEQLEGVGVAAERLPGRAVARRGSRGGRRPRRRPGGRSRARACPAGRRCPSAKYVCSPLERSRTRSLSSPNSRRAQPQRAVVAVGAPLLLEHLEGVLDLRGSARRLGVVQRALAEELVELDPERGAGSPRSRLEHERDRPPRRPRPRAASPRPRAARRSRRCSRPDVAVLGRLLAPRARLDRLAEAARSGVPKSLT